MNRLVHNYPCVVNNVIDGRIFEGLVDHGWSIYSQRRLIIEHLDALDKPRNKDPQFLELAARAKECLSLAALGKKIIVAPVNPGVFGRTTCRAHVYCREPMEGVTVEYAAVRFLDLTKFQLHLLKQPTPFEIEEAVRVLNAVEVING